MNAGTSLDPRIEVLLNAWTDNRIDRRQLMQGILATGGAAALAGVMPRLAMGQSATPVPAYDGELADEQVMRLPLSEPTTMDPGVSFGDSELSIFFNIFEGLVGVDQKTGEVVPRLAESWEPNEDGSEFVFTLREDVTWSDGTPINANDFVYSWQRVLDPETLSQYIPALYPIKNAEAIANGEAEMDTLGVVATDDYTLTVTLEGSTTYFPLLATTWTFSPVPKHVIDEVGAGWVEAENIVSNGPYMMTEWNHDQSIVLEANPEYYGDAPTVTRAEYRLFEDPSTQAYIAFENDELDYAAPEGPDLDRVLADPEASQNLVTFALSNCYFVVADCSTPPTDTVEFRQALYKAIDRETLATTVLANQFLPAFTILPPDIAGNNPDAAMTESAEEAQQLLADAGIDPASVSIELLYLTGTDRYKTVAEYLQSAWGEALGISVELTPLEDSAYIDWRASRETQPFNTYTGVWGSDFSDPSNWHNQNFTSQADHYRNHWQNDEFDDLVAEAGTNTDQDERTQQYREAEVIIVREAPIIPMYRSKAFRAVKPWVKDLYFQPMLSVVHLRNVKIAPR
jgi:oligopeptide transport system substrate-binding protein